MCLVFAALWACARLQVAAGANWGQCTGPKQQNVARSTDSKWSPRWGHTAVTVQDTTYEMYYRNPNTFQHTCQENPENAIFLLGGDDMDEGGGGGGYHNDVWMTSGLNFSAVLNGVTKEPELVSTMGWSQVSMDAFPPTGVTYDAWLWCVLRKWTIIDKECAPEDDPYKSRRWAPRRNHEAVYWKKKVWVLGGRARSFEDIPEDETVGGIGGRIGAAGAPSSFQSRWREKTRLVNDVWSMSPLTKEWVLVNPGCRPNVHHASEKYKTGTRSSSCAESDDCYGDSDCRCQDGSTEIKRCRGFATCVCNIWSPRERHSAAVQNGHLYVAGGIVNVESQMCGPFACGGRYRQWVNDVWRARGDTLEPGKSWEMVTSSIRQTTQRWSNLLQDVISKFADIGSEATNDTFAARWHVARESGLQAYSESDGSMARAAEEEVIRNILDIGTPGKLATLLGLPSRHGGDANPIFALAGRQNVDEGNGSAPTTHLWNAVTSKLGEFPAALLNMTRAAFHHFVAVIDGEYIASIKAVYESAVGHDGARGDGEAERGKTVFPMLHTADAPYLSQLAARVGARGLWLPFVTMMYKYDAFKFLRVDEELTAHKIFMQRYPVPPHPLQDRWSPREGHRLIVANGHLWLMGGRGGFIHSKGYNPLFNDVWRSTIGDDWLLVRATTAWPPRVNFAAGVTQVQQSNETAAWTDRMFVYGGEAAADGNSAFLLQDVWWSDDGATWTADFSNGTESVDYVSPSSELKYLQTMGDEEINKCAEEQIFTISQLSGAPYEKIMRLRDFSTHNFPLVCDHKKRAEAIVKRCTNTEYRYDGYENMYFRAGGVGTPSEGEAAPLPVDQTSLPSPETADAPQADPPTSLVFGADGCVQAEDEDERQKELDHIHELQKLAEEGWVLDPTVTCKWVWANRSYHAGTVFCNDLYVIGGRAEAGRGTKEDALALPGRVLAGSSGRRANLLESAAVEDEQHGLLSDTWYRDATMPTSEIELKPADETYDEVFQFGCNKGENACIFQFRLYHIEEKEEKNDPDVLGSMYKDWTLCLKSVNFVEWLPGGRYRVLVRAIDPSGNIDLRFEDGRNVYTWTYTPRLPLALILGTTGGFLVVCLSIFLEVRRRRKKKAMERYAMKRMRRKFKGIQKETAKKDVDWRKYYDDEKK